MIFNRIDLFQYRCFLDTRFEFVSSKKFKKNITLIKAPNGSGKTELLFAFWWALYGEDFDFTTLNNKETTPYALNLEVYKAILSEHLVKDNFCRVELEFEHDGIVYTLERRESYTLDSKGRMIQKQTVKLSQVDEYGKTGLPDSDSNSVKRKLENIIPKKLLSGLIFDGERMNKLSSSNDAAIEGIEAVISDITSKDLIVDSLLEFDSLYRKYNSEIKRMSKDQNTNLFTLQSEIEEEEKEVQQNKRTIEILDNQKKSDTKRLEEISLKLSSYERNKELEKVYLSEKGKLTSLEEQYYNEFDDLYAELSKNSAMILAEELFNNVGSLISDVDVPEGLNVEAVESILSKEQCICGTDINEEVRALLEELKLKLPPDNVNSLLTEIIRQKNLNVDSIQQRLTEIWNNMSKFEEDIKKTKEVMRETEKDMTVTSSDSEDLIKEREKIRRRQKMNIEEIDRLTLRNEVLAKSLKLHISRRDKITSKQQEYDETNKKLDFVNKSMSALQLIQERYVEKALKDINKYLMNAYEQVSEDFKLGRRIYITQYTEPRYKIVSYFPKDVEHFEGLITNDTFKKYEVFLTNVNEDITKEIAILENALPNSTGQSKAVSIAFVKAILDYSMQKKETIEDFEISKKYPVVIDAPFGDLSGENLKLPACNLHLFSEQVILMLSPSSYEGVKEYLTGDIGKTYKLRKNEEKSVTSIEG